MDPLQTWAALAAIALTAYVVIAERHGWLNQPTPQHTDTDAKDQS